MTKLQLTLKRDQEFFLSALRKDKLDEAIALCDLCVGKNMYSREELEETIEKNDSFFYLLETPEGEAVGYLYFYLTNPESLAAYTKLNKDMFLNACPRQRAGLIKSIGLKNTYRRLGIAEAMIHFSLDRLKAMGTETVFVICWKILDHVPLKNALNKNSFVFLSEAYRVWYDLDDLVCPVCNGRCVCDAAVYYKPVYAGGLSKDEGDLG